MYESVIVAVDGSDDARRAARTGFALARKAGASVRVLNVLERSLLDVLRSSSDRDQIREERMELLAEFESEATAYGIEAETSLLEGKPSAQIAAVAEDEPNPVIVLGRQGRSTVSRKLMGGVTERVLEAGVAPVLVEPADKSRSEPLELREILLPTDGSSNADRAIPHGGALATETGARVHLLSVLDLQRAGGVFNAGGLKAEFVEHLESEVDDILESAVTAVADQAPSLDVQTVRRKSTNFDGVSGAIETYTETEDIDLVVMGSHGRSNVSRQVLGSVTSTVLRSVDVPVLVVPRDVQA
ncbi:universal stress protein [Halodesulfurarchaeum sp.]|uniref:universal stress protein n=1 Tax=Halodesulfurarchaeum sp. TaxID=1980530 RepID=UPI001BB9E8B9|nr:universal stress protein [Halodesulfurarchaeum sp.]